MNDYAVLQGLFSNADTSMTGTTDRLALDDIHRTVGISSKGMWFSAQHGVRRRKRAGPMRSCFRVRKWRRRRSCLLSQPTAAFPGDARVWDLDRPNPRLMWGSDAGCLGGYWNPGRSVCFLMAVR